MALQAGLALSALSRCQIPLATLLKGFSFARAADTPVSLLPHKWARQPQVELCDCEVWNSGSYSEGKC